MVKTRRILGTVLTVILVILALGDAPEQLRNWRAGWQSFSAGFGINWQGFWSGNGGRYLLVAIAIAVGLWAWDIPQRALDRFRKGKRKPIDGESATTTDAIPERPYPTVLIFRHKEARKHNDAVFHRIRAHFADAGWRVESSNTDLPEHENGIRVAGKAGYEREAAKWALASLGIEWIPDERINPPEILQVIVGRYEDKAKHAPDVEQITKALIAERDSLRKGLEETQREREMIRGNLANENATLKTERDKALEAYRQCKRALTESRFERFVSTFDANTRVTVRAATYDDWHLIEAVKKLLADHTNWPVTIDMRNEPALIPHDELKVVVGESDRFLGFLSFLDVEDGKLLPCRVGIRSRPDGDTTHLIIEILPTIKH
jgi:hypothetical protein